MAGESKEAKRLLSMLAEKEEMQMAEALLGTMSRNQQEWENQYGYERFVHDCVSREKYAFMKGEQQGIQQGMQQGIQQGISQGERKAKIEAAKNALSIGLTAKQAAQIANLPIREVENL